MPPHPPPFSLQAHQQKAMPLTTAIATNLPPRPPPSSVVEPIQRSPVLSPKVADPRQQRSGSVHPSSSPQRLPTPPQLSPYQKTENGSQELPPIDEGRFQEILDLDEDDEPFAWGMVLEYLDQAKVTFEQMEEAIAKKDCKKLSSLGHFLKGSSAALGVTKVEHSCESIQHYGNLRDNKAEVDLTSDVALSKISATLKEAKEQYKEAETWLRDWHSGTGAQDRITKGDDDD